MSFFSRFKGYIATKVLGDVIFPTWDSIDTPSRSTSLRRSQTDFLNYNRLTLYVNRAVNKRAEKVSQVQFQLKKGEDIIEDHEILTLLNRPNPNHTGRQFWKLYQKHLDITGAAYIYVFRKQQELFAPETVELHLLRPDLVELKWENGEIVGYRYKHGRTGKYTDFDVDEVIYSFNPDPMRPLEGESLLQAGIREMDIENQLSDFQSNVLRNGGYIDTVMSFKAGLTKKQLDDLEEQYAEKHAKATKAGRPLFMGGDADIKRLALNPEELSYLESKKVTLNDVCLMTGVPRALLAQTGDETYANADAAHNIFLRETIKPLLEDLTSILDWRFVPEEFDLTFVDPTPEDVDRTVKIVTAANNVHAATPNEKREMLGLEPLKIPEADQVYVPFSETPLEEADDPKPEPEPEPADEKGVKVDHPLRDEFVRRRYEKLMIKRYDRREQQFRKAMEGYFKAQQNRLIDHVQGTRTYRRKDLFGEAFDPELELKLAKDTALPLIKEFVEESGQQALELIGSADEFVLSGEIRNWIDQKADKFASDITETTLGKLKDEFEESLETGENRQALIERIQGTYDGFTESRARTIARTEVHNATQRGTFAGYTQANIPIKIWVAVGDLNTRDAHLQADGQERPINSAFDVGGEKLMYPGDPSGSAGNVINCRCTI